MPTRLIPNEPIRCELGEDVAYVKMPTNSESVRLLRSITERFALIGEITPDDKGKMTLTGAQRLIYTEHVDEMLTFVAPFVVSFNGLDDPKEMARTLQRIDDLSVQMWLINLVPDKARLSEIERKNSNCSSDGQASSPTGTKTEHPAEKPDTETASMPIND